ncbi:lipase [Parashewanella spongiae]|uniref:Lipase n=1 Tax=Parashewanella spongiae TaxID=342950 RepID=A0A3A6U606_9GAMM|nr:VolA/Pla-1 family phospholipase [Parashewanella spongiae]MCL1076731.1 lipase [Parashewanella spongiae]RJY19472.1 lipase [Parashewanella spongiae]
MKKLLLSAVIASTLGLTACGGDSVDKIDDSTVPLIPQSHLVFDPTNAKLPLPNDLLFSGTQDGTLNIPGEETGDFANPQIALGALDGWSLTQPISINVDLPKFDRDGTPIELSITESSVQQPGAVRVFEATTGGPLSSDPECTSAPSLTACKLGDELQFGVDFVTAVSGSSIAIVPIKPLKAEQSYLYVTTDKIMDSEGRSIAASATYNLLKLDLATQPLGSDAQKQLQGVVNNYENSLQAAHDVDPDSITYAGMFTTQSIGKVLEVTKAKMAQDFLAGLPVAAGGQGGDFGPYAPLVMPRSVKPLFNGDGSIKNAADVLGIEDPLQRGLLESALVFTAKLRLPIFSACSSQKCGTRAAPDVNGMWHAQGDSPIAVLSALQSGKLTQAEYGAQAVAQGISDPVAALSNPALLVGKQFKLADGTSVDTQKQLTRFNPLPALQLDENGAPVYETVDVQITIPKLAEGETPPAGGFPVAIAMHGLGAAKESNLAFSGLFALSDDEKSEVATISIDMPLHNKRSFSGDGSSNYVVSSTEADVAETLGLEGDFTRGTPLAFVNVSSPLSITSNFRQATIDHLALRLVLPVIAQNIALNPQLAQYAINPQNPTVLGLSLGAIVTTDFSVLAKSGLRNPFTDEVLPNPYDIKSASLVAPGSGLAGSFASSPTFGHLLYNNIITRPEFIQLVNTANTNGAEASSAEYEAIQHAVYQGFVPQLGFAVQTVLDKIDPISHAAALKASELPVHVIEIVGDGSPNNLPDQVLPNRFNGLSIDQSGTVLPLAGFPLSGTEPFIAALGLPCVDTTTEGSGAVRFVKGHHSSLISPTADTLDVTLAMQQQVFKFSESAHDGNAQIFVDENSSPLLKGCSD